MRTTIPHIWRRSSLLRSLINLISIFFLLAGCSGGSLQKAVITYNTVKNSYDIIYDGEKIAEGTLEVIDSSGNPVSDNDTHGRITLKTDIESAPDGGVTQHFNFYTKNPDYKISMKGHLTGDMAFSCSPEKQGNLPEVIRVASGMSTSRLNTGIYSPSKDWALFFENSPPLSLEQTKTSDPLRSFAFTIEADDTIFLLFKPGFYRKHRDHHYYDPLLPRQQKAIPCGWISWKAYGGGITEKDVMKVTDWCSAHLADYGLEYIIIDDGWFKGSSPSGQMYNVPPQVDWTRSNAKFPSGIKNLADYIHQHKLKAGIWLSPFGFSGDPNINPDYWIRRGAGKEFLYNEWHGLHYCDGTNKEAVEHWLTRGVKTQENNGIDLFKLDGMYHIAYEGYQNTGDYFTAKKTTWQQALRIGWQELYNAAEGDYVLSCWGRVPEIAGIPDAIRIGQDKDSQWIYIPIVAEDLWKYLYEHTIIWTDDPDHIVFRDLSAAESRTWATLVGITGTLLTFSDKPEQMTPEKLSILKKVIPVMNNPPVKPLNLFSYDSPPLLWSMEIHRDFENWLVIANSSATSSVNEISFTSIGLDPHTEYTVFDFWNREFRGVYTDSFICGPAPFHDTSVFGIRELKSHPWVLSVDRHISQGGVSLETLMYERDRLKGTLRVVKNDPYSLYLFTHGRKIEKVIIEPEVPFDISTKGYCAAFTINSPLTQGIHWEIVFGEKNPQIIPLKNEELNPILMRMNQSRDKKMQNGTLYLSDVPWKSSQNGWGPVEPDMSNGESGAGDGKRLAIAGIFYDKGLGTHAESEIVYALNKKFSRFKAFIGIDDETSASGSVVFRVFADGKELFTSRIIKGGEKPEEIDLDIKNRVELKLIVNGTEDGISFDHADWAEARVVE
ncbi:MAG: NPCBM/NEW2 domain-containing protein [Spirochaetales bacterium]|nr:NPCBM/NEW2 domain-containing protein [Spirochaetales bacterium]